MIAAPTTAAHFTVLLDALSLPRKTTVVDVGANPANEPPYAALRRAGACTVVGFEPLPEAFAALDRDKGPDEVYYNAAVGDGTTRPFHIYRSPSLSSVLQPHAPGFAAIGRPQWAEIERTVKMKTVALDKLKGLVPFDLLKMDLQGGEGMVLTHARRVLKQAVAVIVELRYMQLYEGEPMLGGVDAELRAQGFMLHKFTSATSRPMPNSQFARLKWRANADQLVDGDAVYLRHPGVLGDYTDAQLMHLALLAGTVFDSQSTVVYALDELVRRGAAPENLPAAYVDALPGAYRRDALG